MLALVQALKKMAVIGQVVVTKSDSLDLTTKPAIGLYVGTGGTVKFDGADATGARSNGLTTAAPDGAVIPGPIYKVWSTGTAASNMLALYG